MKTPCLLVKKVRGQIQAIEIPCVPAKQASPPHISSPTTSAPRTDCPVSPHVPKVLSGDPVDHKLPDFRVRPDVPATVPQRQPAEGPGSQRGQPGQLQFGTLAGPD